MSLRIQIGSNGRQSATQPETAPPAWSRLFRGCLAALAVSTGACQGMVTDSPTPVGVSATPAAPTAAAELTPGSGEAGLVGSYYGNRDLTGTPAVVRTDATVNFDWGSGAPASAMATDNFSARWSGFVEAPETGVYTFTTRSDDGVRLWVGEQKIVDNWTDHAPRNDSGDVELQAGQRYAVKLEYYERGGGAVMQLSWSYGGRARAIVPADRLFGTDAAAPPSVPVTPAPTPTPTPTPAPAPTPTPPAAQSGCAVPAALADVSRADRVVGTGTPASCTEAALDQALAGGGVITFNCGSEPFTFKLTSGKSLNRDRDTTIDGGGKITFDGQAQVRPLKLDHWFDRATPVVRVQNMKFINGKSTGSAHPSGLGIDTDGGGGAIYLRGGSLIVHNSTFEDNKGPVEGPDVGGGAIYGVGIGKITIVNSTLRRNECANGGAVGALFMSLAIVDSVLANNKATGFGANWDDGTAQHGRGGNGGAIVMDGKGERLDLCGVRITDNVGGAFGGAIFQTAYDDTQKTTIDRTVIRGNSIVQRPDTAGAGGLYLQGPKVTITASTIADNRSQFIGGLWVLNHGATAARLDMTNVTVTGNHNSGWGGAGIEVQGPTAGTWQNVTVFGNTGGNNNPAASGIGSVTATNCIFGGACSGTAGGQNNVQWPSGGTACASGATWADPKLAALADNGGVTPTMLPGAGSAATGAGATCAAADQRGVTRATACTVGAVEVP